MWPTCWPTWWPTASARWPSSGPAARPRRSRPPPAGCSPRSPRTCRTGWRPTGRVTYPRSGGRWRPTSSRAGCSRSPRPTRSSWAWTSPVWTPCCWLAGPAPGPRSGSRPAGPDALAVLVARDDPLDTYLTHHPETLFGRPVETTVLDPGNPHVLAPHLCAAAAELPPLTADDLATFAPDADEVAEHLVTRGMLRRRSSGLYWTRPERASDLADIRGVGAGPVGLVEEGTG